MYDLAKVRAIRKKLGLTQKELAAAAGVSQSMIAKLESGQIDPSYSTVQKVFSALERSQKKREPKASEFLKKRIITTSSSKGLNSVVRKMRKHDISQLPVLSRGKLVGLVTESTILSSMLSGDVPRRVREVMRDAPPVVSKDAGIKVILDLLNHYPAVLVADKGKIKGIVTKSDVISQIE